MSAPSRVIPLPGSFPVPNRRPAGALGAESHTITVPYPFASHSLLLVDSELIPSADHVLAIRRDRSATELSSGCAALCLKPDHSIPSFKPCRPLPVVTRPADALPIACAMLISANQRRAL